MSEATPPAAPVAPTPAPVAAPTPHVAASPAPAAQPSEEPKVGEPGWLKARLDREAEKVRKESRKELKTERRALRTAADEVKALGEKATAEVAAAKLAVDAILADVPEAERAAITKAGGASIAKTLEAFSVWKAAKGMGAAPPVAAPPAPAASAPAAAATPAASAPLAAPAQSAPAAAAPAPASPGAPENHIEVYKNLKQSNPYLAAQYLEWNATEIYPDKLITRK